MSPQQFGTILYVQHDPLLCAGYKLVILYRQVMVLYLDNAIIVV